MDCLLLVQDGFVAVINTTGSLATSIEFICAKAVKKEMYFQSDFLTNLFMKFVCAFVRCSIKFVTAPRLDDYVCIVFLF